MSDNRHMVSDDTGIIARFQRGEVRTINDDGAADRLTRLLREYDSANAGQSLFSRNVNNNKGSDEPLTLAVVDRPPDVSKMSKREIAVLCGLGELFDEVMRGERGPAARYHLRELNEFDQFC
jgi:hypothetical protein